MALEDGETYWKEQSHILRGSELLPLLLERVLQHHSGDDLHHLLQGDVVGVPSEGPKKRMSD